jgi:hypothetical protein
MIKASVLDTSVKTGQEDERAVLRPESRLRAIVGYVLV